MLRVITGTVLLVLVFLCFLLLSVSQLILVSALVLLLAAMEWGNLVSPNNKKVSFGYALVLLGAGYGAYFYGNPVWVLSAGVCWWSVAFGFVLTYPKGRFVWSLKTFRSLVGLLVLIPAFIGIASILRMSEHGIWVLLYGLSVVWIADIGAYYAGRRFGKTPLAPYVSPKKTWEGALFGIFLNAVVAVWISYVFRVPAALVVGLSMVLASISIVGDLAESILKRVANVKDSGTLLPGHGGILDRIDGVLAVMPLLAWGLLLWA